MYGENKHFLKKCSYLIHVNRPTWELWENTVFVRARKRGLREHVERRPFISMREDSLSYSLHESFKMSDVPDAVVVEKIDPIT